MPPHKPPHTLAATTLRGGHRRSRAGLLMGAQRNLVFLITAVVLFVLYLRRPPVPDLNADDADFSSDDNVAGDSETNAQRTQAIRARTPVRSKHRPAARPGSAQPSRSEDGVDPTSGLLAVVASLNWCRTITAYGFGESFGSTNTLLGMSSPYHYYKFYGMRDKGNVGAHAFEAESMLMQELLDSDRVHPPEGHPWHLKDRGQHAYYRHNLRICHSYDSERGPDNSKGWCRAPGVSLPQPLLNSHGG